MTVPASQIVKVIPSVLSAGGTALDLQGMMLTNSTRVPIGTVQTFLSANGVGEYFGLTSHEFAVANNYFAGFNNSTVKPASILFTQYNVAAVAAYLRSGPIGTLTLAQLQSITGTLTVTMDGFAHVISDVDLSADNSFSAAAATLQGAFTNPTEATCSLGTIAGTVLTVAGSITGQFAVGQTISGASVTTGSVIVSLGTGTGGAGTYNLSLSSTVGSGEVITAAATPITVAYDSVSGSFVFTSGITGVASTSAFATGSAAAPLLMTQVTGAVISQGAAAAVPGVFMTQLTNVTQNWATFMLTFNPDVDSENSVRLAFAAWNNTQQNRYMFVCWDTDASPTVTVPAMESLGYLINTLNNYSGTCLVWEVGDQLVAPFICGWAASLNFAQTNGRADLCFRSQTGLVAAVTDINVATNLTLNGYNYYEAMATANQQFLLLYNGSVSGPFKWADSYVNQIWLNNELQLDLVELLVNQFSVPYNAVGDTMIESSCLDTINEALNFGVIRTGILLSADQKIQVNSLAGIPIDGTITQKGWYFQSNAATTPPEVRAARGSPVVNFWYTDGGSIQQITLNSIEIQ